MPRRPERRLGIGPEGSARLPMSEIHHLGKRLGLSQRFRLFPEPIQAVEQLRI